MRIFLILLGFQITWAGCIFGEYFDYPWLGVIIGILYLILFYFYTEDKKFAFKTIAIFSVPGYIFDSSLQALKIYKIESDLIIGYLPVWMIILWPTFTTLFVQVLNFLRNKPILAIILGMTLGPGAYYSGVPLGIASYTSTSLGLGLMAIFWGALMFLYSIYIKITKPISDL
ncbi:MAG: hypothetical protein CFH26_00741 [Alphaproteobacteria bacterium MarineAlpha6_Bin4]|nr:MAG: hypothetical protein CFH25_00350 [Alphaproteobacteria bacterium MarineAlpha6_Bin3]PPR37459.1 MAG: hypothetical protein CFH26_00741 [Alphaproteobacteria bacterium MarineAlpha6_Bin4]|tara:strand:- start:18802 stop:19317 length:516 start_codon:yes stop_codon:yes gene_type:complete